MKENTLGRIICILISICFLLPTTILTNDEVMGEEGKGDGYIYCWREGESWDRSYDNDTGLNWKIFSWDTASNDNFTRQSDLGITAGDYAEWDFNVNEPGDYYIWIRGWKDKTQSANVELYWNNSLVDNINWDKVLNYWFWYDYTHDSGL